MWPVPCYGKKLVAQVLKNCEISHTNRDSWPIIRPDLPGLQSHNATVAGAKQSLPLAGASTPVPCGPGDSRL